MRNGSQGTGAIVGAQGAGIFCENSLPQARSGQIRVIFYAKGRPLWRDGAGGRTGFLELFSR